MEKVFVELKQIIDYRGKNALEDFVLNSGGKIEVGFGNNVYILVIPKERKGEIEEFQFEGRQLVSKVYEGRISEVDQQRLNNTAVQYWHRSLEARNNDFIKTTAEQSDDLRKRLR